MRCTHVAGLLWLFWFAVMPVQAQPHPGRHIDIDPEAHFGASGIKISKSEQFMVVTANPHASRAARSILSRGGSAVDAAIAAQLVLTLVEPQSSGIGGGAFMLHWRSADEQLQLFDGRETAPAGVNDEYFLNPDKTPMKFFDALIGGHSVGVPGVVKMMSLAHREHGTLSWEELFKPAIELSRRGFKISPRLHGLLGRFNKLLNHPSSRAYFYLDSGEPKPVGTVLKNPDYASTLELLASKGEKAFYEGGLAKKIVAAVSDDGVKPGTLTIADMNKYQAPIRLPLCSDYRGYRVCTTPPPSSGATVLQILGTMEQLPQPAPAIAGVDWIHRFAEASSLSFADRNTYIADPDFVDVPVQAMISPAYLKQRSQLINLKKASTKASAGQPELKVARQESISPEFPSTSHLSIVDAKGNAVSMTSSIQMAFGSGVMVGGFLLNNQLTDFSFVPRDVDQKLIANRVQPGKRPRSSMSPTIVFKEGRPVLLIGSPGGSRIIDYVARVVAYCIEGEEGVAQAIASPNVVDMNRRLELEKGGFSNEVIDQLKAMGHEVVEVDLNSGMHGITVNKNGFTGGADPRREGIALGE